MGNVKKERTWVERFPAEDAEALACAEKMAKELGVSFTMAVLLYNRGYRSAEEALRFLRFETTGFHDPFGMKDMDLAVARILRAVKSREKIYIYGDYDVDGVTSVSMLYLYLTELGGLVEIKIPKRDGEGYGLSCAGVEKIAEDGGKLIVTVDTGITAVQEIAYAKTLGVDVVVTDHHKCQSEMPVAEAVVNPHRPDCSYPFCELAGVGVVFKLVCAMEMKRRGEAGESVADGIRSVCARFSDLVAIGTIADVMPLVDENRLIVGMGLRQIENTDRVGLSALIEAVSPSRDAGALKKRKISSGFIGFAIAPRINAAGRMSDATIAVRLLLAQGWGEARRYAEQLCEINRRRQQEENEIAEEAYRMIEEVHDLSRDRVIVLDHDGWQQGIIGIVSSRITEKYGLPSVLISYGNVEGEAMGSDMGKGSGRSVKGLNLVEALRACEDCLEKYGGHELAAGLTLKRSSVAEFRRRINAYAEEAMAESDLAVTLEAECELEMEEISLSLAEETELLEPFGGGNAVPQFVMRDVKVVRIISIGGGKHTKLILEKNGGSVCGMYFGVSQSELGFEIGDSIDVFFQLDINDYKNVRSVQMILRDARPSERFGVVYAREKERYEEIHSGGSFSVDEEILPDRDDFGAVYTLLRREYRAGNSVMDMKTLLKQLAAGGTPQHYAKLRYILEIMNELELCVAEPIGEDLFRFAVDFHANKTSIEKSSILKWLRGRCYDRAHR